MNRKQLKWNGVILGMALVLTIIFVLSTLTGCSGNPAGNESPADVALAGAGSISVAVYSDFTAEFVNKAARAYENQHEGVTIEVVNYSGEEPNRNYMDEYVQALNTALMGGKGEDIVDMDGLALFRMVEKDMLVNLDDYIGGSLNDQEYYMSILDGWKFDGKRYVLPVSFNFEAVQMDPDMAAEFGVTEYMDNITLKTLPEIGKKMPQRDGLQLMNNGGFGSMSDMELAYFGLSLHQKSFLDIEKKTVSYDSPAFRELIDMTLELSGRGLINASAETRKEGYVYSYPEEVLINMVNVYGPADTHNGLEDFTGYTVLKDDQGQGLYYSGSILPAINKNSQNPALAADFILFLISEEMQTLPEIFYTPVNRKAMETKGWLRYQDYMGYGGFEDFTEEMMAQNFVQFSKMVDVLGVPARLNRDIDRFVNEELRELYSEKQNVDVTAQNLQTKVSTYLEE